MQIVVRVGSGLGNQLFQYAAGRYLAQNFGASLRIAHARPQDPRRYPFTRYVLLREFAIAAKIGRINLWDNLALSTRPRSRAAGRMLRAVRKIQVIRQSQGPEVVIARDGFQIRKDARVVYLVGYWQCHSMVDRVETELRREFSFVEPLRGGSLKIAERISAAHTPVSIHLRRGDYATAFGVDSILPMAYYEQALGYMMDRFAGSVFFVFSDDPPFAKQWARRDPRLIVVDHNDAATAHEDLRLMSLCRHHIIANSTFSWWGAWLNPRSDKTVIAPASWLGSDTAKSPIADPKWVLL